MSTNLRPARVTVSILILAVALLPTYLGCGQGKFPLAKAKGKVVCNGQPVTSGSVTFSPMGESEQLEVGKPATAAVGPDGTFVLSTNDRFDGAVIGKHRVVYVGPEGEDNEEESATSAEGSPEELAKSAERARKRQAQLKSQCVQQGEIVVEVKASGENDFTIELVPAGR
jgi:hypothetical protein